MKLLTTFSIIAALGLSACNSKSGDTTEVDTKEKVMEEKATDTATKKPEAAAEEVKKVEEQTTPESKPEDASAANIVGTYWKLVTLEGKEISDAENPHDQPHFMLNTEESRVSGNDGCNGFFGSYTLEADNNRIKFDQIGSTKRMCADTVVNEQEFMQVFGQADSYRIIGDNLELYIGRRAPLAVFKAVDAKTQ